MKRFFNSSRLAGATLFASRGNLRSKLILGVALAAFSLGNAAGARPRSFPIPTGSQPISITMGAEGNFWFTLQNSSQVARITPQGVMTEFVPPSFSSPFDITPGPEGNVWFSEGFDRADWIYHPVGRDHRDHVLTL
jgi:streptogramin lyase